MSASIVLQYNRKTIQSVSMSAEPAGAQNISWSQNGFDFVTLPTTIPFGAPLNTHFYVTTYVAVDGVTIQENYTYNVSDLNNITLGSVQYNLNYVNPSSGGITTNIPFLNSTVFVANGVFAPCTGAQVNMAFDNVNGDRVITITRYASCGCRQVCE